MAEILGKDLDNWDDSLAAREPYSLSESSTTGAQFITGADLLRSAKISSEWRDPVAIYAQAYNPMSKPFQVTESTLTSTVDAVRNLPPNVANLGAQTFIELTEGGQRALPDVSGALKAKTGEETLDKLRKALSQSQQSIDEAVFLLKDRDYPVSKFARRVIADTTANVENRRIVRELYNQAHGIDSSKWYNEAGSIIGAMLPAMAAGNVAFSGARAFGAGRLASINMAKNIVKGYIGAEMAGQYAEETAAEYLARTGDKNFEKFTAKDASGLMAAAYGAIGAQIEFMGGVEPVFAGVLTKVGLRSGALKAAAKIGVGEATEELLQGLTETLMRKIDGTSDKTWKEGFEESLKGATWGLFIGGTLGTTAFYTNRRNLVKGIKVAVPGIEEAQAELIADAMIDTTGEISSQEPSLRNNLRQKVELMYKDADIENKEDRIDAITDLEYGLVAMDAAERGIELAEHELFSGEVNELGWFRAGIPEARRVEIQEINDNIRDLKTQLKELNKAEQKDWAKIEETENKLAQANQYVLEKLNDLARDDAAAVRRILQNIENKYVIKEKKKAKTPVGWFADNIVEGQTFTTDEGTFKEYQLRGDNRNMATFTVFESPDGWIVRNAYVPESMQKKGVATNFYNEMNQRSIDATGKPLRSTQPRTLKSGKTVFELSDAGKKLWDSLVKRGTARKLSNGTYEFSISRQPMFQEQFDIADENARLDDIYPEYTGETINIDGKERSVYNSNGDRIAKSAEALRNFYKWFGDSKVVDGQDRPLVVYHGTKAQFDTFETTTIGKASGNAGFYGTGFYFTDKQDEAQIYAETAYVGDVPLSTFSGMTYEQAQELMKKNAVVMPLYLKLKNPFMWDNIKTKAEADRIAKQISMSLSWNKTYKEINRFTDDSKSRLFSEKLKELGYDGVIKGIEFIAFEPNQIKSVENRGTFSDKTGNIYWQSAYAGSRADYDKPSLEAIGSGEGNQAHGWGLYYALNPEIAENYRKKLADDYNQKILYKGKEISYDYHNSDNIKENVLYEIELHMDEYDNNIQKTIDAFITKNKQELSGWETRIEADKKLGIESFAKVMAGRLNLLKEKITILQSLNEKDFTRKQKGQVHEVDIPEMDVLLDEQKTFSEQSDFVREQLAKIGSKYLFDMSGLSESEKIAEASKIMKDWDGAGIYDRLSTEVKGDKRASQVLEKYGIKGITYEGRIDGRCFVIFNPESVKVLRKKFDELGNVLFQNRVSGAAPSTYRGAYIPQYRFILRANRMDASTLSHELAHDWFETNFARYRSGKATKDFMRAWGALEKALGVPENATSTPRQASEAFARAYEAWIVQNEDWAKLVNVEDKDRDAVEKLMKDYQNDLRDIYNDISNPYFKQTWGKLGELKPELKAWFDRVVNITDLDVMVERGEMTAEEAGAERLNRAIDNVIEKTADAETVKVLKEVRTLNDTQRYEAEGGNKNSLQMRLSALAREIDENNMLVKENYDTRRDMMAVAEAADNFVKTRLDDALAIINGQMAEVEGLYKEDLYTALERLAIENGDLGLIDELKNSEIANRLGKELGQRVAGFRNFKQSTDLDVVSALKSLDNSYNKALENKKAQKQFNEALAMLDKSLKVQDSIADKQLDATLKELECK